MEKFESHYDKEEKDTEQLKDISSFMKKYELGPQDMFLAYQMALGVSEEGESRTEKKEVQELAGIMEKHMDEGLPLNKIADFITAMTEFENIPETFYSFVDALSISDREKYTLKSIVKEKKSGELSILDAESDKVLFRVNIKNSETSSENEIAFRFTQTLMHVLEKIQDREIEFLFSVE